MIIKTSRDGFAKWFVIFKDLSYDLPFGTLSPMLAASFVSTNVDILGRKNINNFAQHIFEKSESLFIANTKLTTCVGFRSNCPSFKLTDCNWGVKFKLEVMCSLEFSVPQEKKNNTVTIRNIVLRIECRIYIFIDICMCDYFMDVKERIKEEVVNLN